MNALALAATGTTYTDSRGTTWHADIDEDGDLVLFASGNPIRRAYELVDLAWGPLVRSSFTADELATIADALATHHDEHEPLEGGPAAGLRDRLGVLIERARAIEALLPA